LRALKTWPSKPCPRRRAARSHVSPRARCCGAQHRHTEAILEYETVFALNRNWAVDTEALTAPRLSIVVLPLVNLSDDPEQQYFADGSPVI
jgi:hypothetical protein